jgi:hypothetical protein
MTSQRITLSKYFKDGIYFTCIQCGNCCRGFNNGEVYIYREDIQRLVDYFKKKGEDYTLTTFSSKFLKIVRTSFYWENSNKRKAKNYSFKALGINFVGDDEQCPFLIDNKFCSVHEARPFQCRAYPIGWNLLINSNRTFSKYAKGCPALRDSLEKKGQYYSPQEIIQSARKEYKMEKSFFLEMKKNDLNLFKTYPFLPKDLPK